MSDINDLLGQLEKADPFSSLPSDQRKLLREKVQFAVKLINANAPRLLKLREQWESAPSGSPWQKQLCEEIDGIQFAEITAMKEAVVEITAAEIATAALKKK